MDIELNATEMTLAGWNKITSDSELSLCTRGQMFRNIKFNLRNGISVGRNWTSTWNAKFFEVFGTNFTPIFAKITVIAWANILNTRYFHPKTADFFLHIDLQLEWKWSRINVQFTVYVCTYCCISWICLGNKKWCTNGDVTRNFDWIRSNIQGFHLHCIRARSTIFPWETNKWWLLEENTSKGLR